MSTERGLAHEAQSANRTPLDIRPPAAGGRTIVCSSRSTTTSRSHAEPVCVGDVWMIVLRGATNQ